MLLLVVVIINAALAEKHILEVLRLDKQAEVQEEAKTENCAKQAKLVIFSLPRFVILAFH